MKNYPTLTPKQHQARRAKGWEIALAGGHQQEFASAIGITPAALCKWLDMWPDLRKALKDNSYRNYSTTAEEADRRLRIVAWFDMAKLSRSAAAREIGISHAGLCNWLRKRQGELEDTINEIRSEQERIAA